MEEERQFTPPIAAQYGMEEQDNFSHQSSRLRKAMVSRQLTVVDYFERSHSFVESEKIGVDWDSSVTARVTYTIRGLYIVSPGQQNLHFYFIND